MLTSQQILEARRQLGISAEAGIAQDPNTGTSLLSRLQGRAPEVQDTFVSRVAETIGDVAQIKIDMERAAQKFDDKVAEIDIKRRAGEIGGATALFQEAGQLALSAAGVTAAVIKGGVKVALSPKDEVMVSELISKFGKAVVETPPVPGIIKWWGTLSPETQDNLEAGGGILGLVTEIVGLGFARRGVTGAIDVTREASEKALTGIKTGIADITLPDIGGAGVIQKGKELVERIPRALERARESIAESALRAEKIKLATPAIRSAMKAKLDERIINTVNEADDVTRQAFSDVLAIAEEVPKKIGLKKQPTIVGGELASQQFDLIIKQKQSVGKQIGEVVKTLSKTEKVNLQDSFKQIDNILSEQGIMPIYTKTGVKLDFTGSKYTPAERTKIQELYNLVIEGGDTLSPLRIRDKDQLFSKLQREAKFEGIGDLIIDTPTGPSSIFRVFRDIFSSKLDTISPEIKILNSEYRKLVNLTDDLEDSIFKTPNFNVTKTADPAEFAKVNLRRIFGEAQSSPAFEAVADAMDSVSRGLGYKGASPKVVAEFAQEMRKLFPETIPKTGFQGGIRVGVADLLETVLKVGKPGLADQQKALRELIDSYL